MQMNELVEKINEASVAYYNHKEIMSNKEYDALLDELVRMESETGIILPNSPSHKVGAAVEGKLPKVTHQYPALSLDKTKDIDEYVAAFEKGQVAYEDDEVEIVLMWKEDGSTIQLTYENGKLVMAATRGNGIIGSDIRHNVPYIHGIPMEIPFKGKLVVRGEGVMSYAEFDRINEPLPEEEQYANPRNLANATITMLDSKEMRKREIHFLAFNLIAKEEMGASNMPALFSARLDFLKKQEFGVVPYEVCSIKELPARMSAWEHELLPTYAFPVDGFVGALNNAAYADTLKGTEHNPHVLRGYAFKWADETAKTVLRKIELSISRTGTLTPIAVFDPVELEGTSVSRAKLHHLSYVLEKNLVVGDEITVYKANKIIPQVDKNLDFDSHPQISAENAFGDVCCPVCGKRTQIVKSDKSDTLYLKCMNPDCAAKKIRKFVHFVGRDCMNIDGISESTIEKFVTRGFIKEYADFWHLDRFKDELIMMEGFGEKSYEKLMNAVNESRYTDFVSFVQALGIPNVGKGQAKLLKKYLQEDHYAQLQAQPSLALFGFLWNSVIENFNFTVIDGIGEVIDKSLKDYFAPHIRSVGIGENDELLNLWKEVLFTKDSLETGGNSLEGKVFVITGEVHHFKNRAELQAKIEELGGKASGSVSNKTSYLINNDVTSDSGKNKKAKELGVPIISEEDFLAMIENKQLA